jgi:thioredoxin-like negative regulator of GroEL/Lon protease-like protein
MIEKVVTEAKGAVKLVKINIDENKMLAQQLRIQSIPAVYAFFGGRPVDGFMGAVPESQIREFVGRLVQASGGAGAEGADDLNAALEHAKQAVAESDFQLAAPDLQRGARGRAGQPAGAGRPGKCYAQEGQTDQALAILASVPAKDKTNAEIVAVRRSSILPSRPRPPGPVGELKAKAAADPKDFQSRLDLAMAYWAGNQKQEAIDELLDMIKLDRNWNEAAARQQLLKVLRGAGLRRSARGRRPQASLDHPVLVNQRSPFDPASSSCPRRCPIFPLSGVLLLPGGKLPLNVFEPRYLAMIFDSLAGHRMIGMVQPMQPGGFAGDGLPVEDGKPKVHRWAAPAASSASTRPRTAGSCWRCPESAASRSAASSISPRAAIAASPRCSRPIRADLDQADELVELDRERLMAALAAFFRHRNLSTDWEAVKQAADRNLITSLSMVLPFGPVEKQALLEAADTTARAKLLIAFLEMGASASRRNPPQRRTDGSVLCEPCLPRTPRAGSIQIAGNPGLPRARTPRI